MPWQGTIGLLAKDLSVDLTLLVQECNDAGVQQGELEQLELAAERGIEA